MRFQLFLLLGLTSISMLAHADETQSFLDARKAFSTGEIKALPQYAYSLRHSVLLPYIEYWQLKSQLKTSSNTDILNFIEHHADSPLSLRLRTDWLQQLGQQQNWHTYLTQYAMLPSADNSLQCYAWQATQSLNPTISPPAEALVLWHTGKPLPSNCSQYFVDLIAQDKLRTEDIWLRTRQALLNNDPSTAQATLSYSPDTTPFNTKQLHLATTEPLNLLNGSHFFQRRDERELVRYAIAQLAQKDPQAAAMQWTRLAENFTEAAQKSVWGVIAYHAALQHLPNSITWFKLSSNQYLDDASLAWETRAALMAGDWSLVHSSILAMSNVSQADPTWRYWLARSDIKLGLTNLANTLLLPLSQEFNFYGLLAAEDLGPVISTARQNYIPSQEEINAVAQLPSIQRALLLHDMNLQIEARQEWRWATRNFDDHQLLAAAELANQKRWLDCAINTADLTRTTHNFALRFLAPYRETAHAYAQQYNLNEAWVYGLIRQESRFICQAYSGVGASGLMQIMPTTAHWIAKQLGLRHFYLHRLVEPDTSLQFGMYYLKTIQQRLGNSDLLATAAYNAGPNRALQWRTEQNLEGAIYAESIPFNETRDYVKKVFANTTFYAMAFHQPDTSLKKRLGTVSIHNAAACLNSTDSSGACADIP